MEDVVYYLQHLTLAGALIVDPFAGGGTVSAASAWLGDRTCIATEINSKTAMAARMRVVQRSPRAKDESGGVREERVLGRIVGSNPRPPEPQSGALPS